MRGLLTLAATMAFVAVSSAPAPAQDAPPAAPVAAAPASAPAGAADAPAAPRAPQGLSESVVVTVNDDLISTYDIVQRMRLLIVTAGIQPNDQNLPEIQREAIRSLVDEHLQLQELRAQGKTQKFDLIASDQEVDDEIAQIARSNNTSATQLLAQLAAQGVGAQTFRDQLRAEISWRGWIRGRYGQRLAIGDDQIKAFQKRLEAEAGKPQYQIGEVFIDASRAGGQAAANQGAEQLISQLQKGAPFAAVARQFSNSPSAANGGDVGWISTGEMPPEVDRVLENLRPGQLSPPIPVKDGVYIVFLKDRRAGGSSTVVRLKQAAIALSKTATPEEVAAAQATLTAMQPKVQGCDNLEAVAAKTPGVVAGDLGEADTKDLAPAFKGVVETLRAGQVSQPVRTDAGLHLIAVCDKHAGGAEQMTKEQIEDRLYGQELSMIAKRQLRDLRNSATIETR
ncbi:MAG: peptidyl-prolyl cis-trans isomerase family protein [Caulobacteraceae bacterium]|nr:peptidyl-prolyl cis-trans isomerase family protein [Caulobacteraceae bacterium]